MRFSDYVVDYALQVNSQSLHVLTGAGEELSPVVVHGLRVNVKRLRAAWQISRHVCDPDVTKAAKRRLGAIHKSLAPSRDAQVIARTISKLAAKGAGKKTRKALQKLESTIDIPDVGAQSRLGATVIRSVAAGFQRESHCWRELEPSDMADGELVARGFGGPFRAGRRLGRRFAVGGPETLLHRWRKYAKHSLYQLDVVAPALGEANLARRWYLERLADGLGRHQDLYMVEQLVERSKLKRADKDRIDKLIGERKLMLESRAMKLYSYLYASKTSKFLDDLIADVDQLALESVIWLPSRMG